MAIAAAAAPLPARLGAQTIAEVQVSPQTMTLAVGEKQAIFAAAFDRHGNLVPAARFTFWTSDSSVARVDAGGTVVGLKPGLAKVEARAQGRRASLAVLVGGVDSTASVRARGVSALTLEPAALRIIAGERVHLVPQGVRDDGSQVPVEQATWKSLRNDIAAVDSSGTVVGVAPGRTIIQAAAEGLMATAPVEVESAEVALSTSRLLLGPGELDTLRVLVPSQGSRVLDAGVQWRSTDTTIARVGPTGIVQAVAPGQAEIVADGFLQERRTVVVVHRTAAALVVTPRLGAGPIQVPLGGTRKFAVAAQAADSTPIPDIRIRWEIGDSAIASFDPATGELTAKALGATSLTARVAGFPPATWAVSVVPNAVRLDRSRASLAPRERLAVTATLLDGGGQGVGPPPALRWTSNRPDVAAVDERGGITAGTLGHAIITAATEWGAEARLDVFVVGDLLVASTRRGVTGIYQALPDRPDSLIPILLDGAQNTQPAYSPDRTRIAFSSNRAARDGNFDLYVMDADGGNVRRLTTEPGTDGEPAWTPDGERLVFSSARQGATRLFEMPVEGGAARVLAGAGDGARSPAVSPDGRAIAFVSPRDGTPHVYRMEADGGAVTRVGTGPFSEASPRFFPNGDLAYAVERSKGSREWRLMRVPAGGAPVALFQTEQPLVTFAPARNGERVVYVTGRPDRPKADYRAYVRGVAITAAPTPLRLQPGEQIPSASF
jgi:TolB protein